MSIVRHRPWLTDPMHDIMAAALLGENFVMFTECLDDGVNPFVPINGSTPSERLRGSLTRLGRMTRVSVKRTERLRRMFNCVLYYESRYTAQWILYRFLCRWCRWRRREVPVREAVWSKKIWTNKTCQSFLGPGALLYSMLHPGQVGLRLGQIV